MEIPLGVRTTQMRPTKSRITRILLLSAAVALWPAGQAKAESCASLFASTIESATSSVGAQLQAMGPQLIISPNANGFALSWNGGTRSASPGELHDVVGRILAQLPDGQAAQIMFDGVTLRDARNLMGTMRLRRAAAAEPAASSGHGGNTPPPDPPTTTTASPADAPRPDPGYSGQQTPHPQNVGWVAGGPPPRNPPATSNTVAAAPRSLLLAPHWRRLNERYDWRAAEVQQLDAPQILVSGGERPAFRFIVTVPASDGSPVAPRTPPQLAASVFFGSDAPPTSPVAIQNSIEGVLHRDEMRSAPVRRAAEAIKREVERQHLGARAEVEVWDMTLVEMRKEDEVGNEDTAAGIRTGSDTTRLRDRSLLAYTAREIPCRADSHTG